VFKVIVYPKIETLFDRDPETFMVIPSQPRLAEFTMVGPWLVTEKIDGTNIRVGLTPEGERLIGGRTDNSQIPTFLLQHLDAVLPAEKLREAFAPDEETGLYPEVTLFGEGYGPKIQKGGGDYRDDPGFILSDVHIGIWLNWSSVTDIAENLGLPVVPVLEGVGDGCLLSMCDSLREFTESVEAVRKKLPEGYVARTDPLLLTRHGKRVMWKLKHSDFRAGKG